MACHDNTGVAAASASGLDSLCFETLIADLSATFVHLRPEQVDRACGGALERLGRFFDVDLCTLLEETEGELRPAHLWAGERVDPTKRTLPSIPEFRERLARGEVVRFCESQDFRQVLSATREMLGRIGMKCLVVVPLRVNGGFLGALGMASYGHECEGPKEVTARLRLMGEILANALVRKRLDLELQGAFREIQKLKERLEAENIQLHRQIRLYKQGEFVGKSDALQEVLRQAEQVAPTGATVLLLGETGTGKELLAHEIHEMSPRRERTMITVNCATLPATLIEGELFGHERGAYTGAVSRQHGRFEVADGSTIFLDEIGELPLELQAKLLRVLDRGEIERLGSTKTTAVDVRIIAATNRDLEEAVKKGTFRKDLYFRLTVFPITVPPLRERHEDIPELVWSFVRNLGQRMGKIFEEIPRCDMETLTRHSWPGNVRELKNVVERALILSQPPTLRIRLPRLHDTLPHRELTLDAVQHRHILEVLEQCGWRVRGTGGAAEVLGVNPSTLDSRMKKLGIERPQ